MHTEIQSRISREIEEEKKEGKDLEPVEEVDLGVEVSFTEDLKQLCQTKAKIIRLGQYSVTGDGVKSAELNKASRFEVSTCLSNGIPTRRSHVVRCKLKSLADDVTTECLVEHKEGGKQCVQYTPTVRGRHELSVTVNGQEVAGSPFPVFVSIHPTLLGKPVRPAITGVGNARDVAVTPTGNIFVTNSWNFTLFDKDGKKLRTIDISKSIARPIGVTVDSTDGFIYVCGGKKVIKLSPNFKVVGEFTGKKGTNNMHLAIVGEEVMVSEDSKNVVMVYSKDLKYVRQIGSHGEGPGQFLRVRGVSSDEHNNLYVSDGNRGCVHVYSNSGEFLHSFGQDEKKLDCPIGVCVFGQYVYVVDNNAHGVSVFTTKGEYVTLFGQTGGDLKYPWGVCVDKNGFVYVCDANNSRVQIF
jgi:DNA-binding beta-propeller fold protein YncE